MALGSLILTRPAGAAPLSQSKIIAPPSGGIYFGQYEWTAGDIAAVESAVGIGTAWYSTTRGHWGIGYSSGQPSVNVATLNTVWNQGRVPVIQCYNTHAGPDDEHPAGFTVDQLLAGTYDANLGALADQLRDYGKPCWFQCAREPNGIEWEWMGGWGPDGDEDTAWAINSTSAYSQFTPPSPPSGAPSGLYDDCSGPTVPDGMGRLKAAQRYYHDFFVRREGLDFLTFDTMGWATRYWADSSNNQDVFDSQDFANSAYALGVFQTMHNFANFYPGDAYCDWVSLTWYMLDYYAADWTFTEEDILLANADWITSLNRVYGQIQSVTSKPILLAELGFPDGMNSNTSRGATKVTDGFNAILDTYTQIKGVSMWANHASWMVTDSFPYDCLIDGGLQATALQNVITAHPGKFHSAVYLTGNVLHPEA